MPKGCCHKVCSRTQTFSPGHMLRIRAGAAACHCISSAEQHARAFAPTVSIQINNSKHSKQFSAFSSSLLCSSEDCGHPIDTVLPPGLELMQQKFTLAGRDFTLVVPRSIDAVLDMYIERGEAQGLHLSAFGLTLHTAVYRKPLAHALCQTNHRQTGKHCHVSFLSRPLC